MSTITLQHLRTTWENIQNSLGEVQADPTANTVLARLKALETALAGTLTTQLTGSNAGKSVSASQTRPNDTTAYAVGDVVGQNPAANITFADVVPDASAGGTFVVLGAKLRIDVAAMPSGMSSFRLHLYNAAPTAILDNAAYNLPSGDRAKYIGYVEISGVQDLGDTLWVQAVSANLDGKLAAASTTLYGVLETRAIYTPTAQAVKTVTLTVAPL